MHAVIVFVVGLPLLLGLSIPTRAQDGPPPVETVVGYYEEENPRSLGEMLYRWNVCFERFVTLNPDLKIDNIPYGTRVLLPKNEPCYDYSNDKASSPTPRLKYYADSAWLNEPYYTEEITYGYFPNIDTITYEFGICRNHLLGDNYALEKYGSQYLKFNWATADIFIPKDKLPCKDGSPASWQGIHRRMGSFLPMDLTAEFNICPEEILNTWGDKWGALYSTIYLDIISVFQIPDSAPPCYNELGQRLIYFDIDGQPLDEPEYSDFQVYRVQPGQTLAEIADQHGVCLVDLARLNYFPGLPIARGEIELFIPKVRPCEENVQQYQLELGDPSVALNVCYEELAVLNPHLYPSNKVTADGRTQPGPYRSIGQIPLLFVPDEAEPCYTTYDAQRGESIFDIERRLNICHETFIYVPHHDRSRLVSTDQTVLYFRRDTRPCYNAQGQRLYYEPFLDGPSFDYFYRDPYQATLKSAAEYAEMSVHVFDRADTVYSVSRQYNVCVHDLLAVNPILRSSMPQGLPTFIPATRPCYDEATGMPLIYEDENGVPLDEPRVGDKLIYYGSQSFARMSSYYNVCQNRIEEANAAKRAGEAHYLGWIIPRDRPSCYDQDGYAIDYALKHHEDSGGIVHTVQFAETLSEIAARYDKSIYWVAAANNLSSLNRIWIDQKLIIPRGVTRTDASTISAALLVLAAAAGVWLWRRR